MTKNINVDGQDHSRNCCPFKYLLSILLRLSPVASLKTIKSHQAWISLCQRTMAVTMYYWDVQNWLTVNVVDQWCTGSYIRGRELSRHSQVNGNRCFFQPLSARLLSRLQLHAGHDGHGQRLRLFSFLLYICLRGLQPNKNKHRLTLPSISFV